MRVIIWISGVVAGVLLILLLTGVVGAESAVDNALRQGNRHFALAEYEQALSFYETGLADSPDNKQLNFCAAQAAYLLGDYGKAAMYYEKSEDCIEKFLNAGNAAVKLGDMLQALRQAAVQDAEQRREQGAEQDAEQGSKQDAEQGSKQGAG